MTGTNGHDVEEDVEMVIPEPLATSPETGAQKLVPFDLATVVDRKALWAANYFVLWPLGLTLAVTVQNPNPSEKELALIARADAFPRHVTAGGEDPCPTCGEFPCLGLVAEALRRTVTDLHVREWTYPDDEQIETINQTPEDNQKDYEAFLGFVRERLLAMKPVERHAALKTLERHSVASADQIVTTAP